MFKNLKIGKKLGLGFGVVLVLLAVVSIYNYTSFNSIDEQTVVAQQSCTNQAFSIEKEVDHLKWMASLSDLFMNDEVTEVTVQTDDHKCGLGKWMYSDETRTMKANDPKLASILDQMAEPHHRLHTSAIHIGEQYVDFDLGLKSLLSDRWIDHLNWIKHVANSNLTKTTFDGGLDAHQCAFGKWYYSYQADNPEFGALLKHWEEPHKHLHESAQEMVNAQKAGNWDEAQKIYYEQTLPTLAELEKAYDQTYAWINETADKQATAMATYDQETRTAVAETQQYLVELKEHFANQSETATAETNTIISSSISIMLILSLIAVVIGLVAAWIITRGITKPVDKVVGLTQQMNEEFDQFVGVVDSIANNDLTQEISQSEIESLNIDSKDEIGVLVGAIEDTLGAKDKIGASLAKMTDNLTTMVRQMGDNSTQLVSAATEVASSSEQMSRGAKDQTDQVTQVSTAVEEMTATIVESARNAGDATEGAKAASDNATNGGQIVNETIQGMQRIADVVRGSSESIGKLAESADQIGEIIGVIDDIADQTNLLALNAAIEAARAGEQGRGFAVVADEVRKLAERTGKATGEITGMIKGIQQGTEEAVGSMETGVQEVDQGRELADKAGNSLTEIVNMSQSVMDQIQQMATASEEQSSAAEQISKNIENVASIARESATGAEQSAAAAEELNRQAEGMQTMVSRFKVKQEA
ncbi:MAG: CZB domain-containing protein [candidate division Zixibacteria bacterium]|nr:CZB domain-containing protein [candidate division Zixibacteria bacterium]